MDLRAAVVAFVGLVVIVLAVLDDDYINRRGRLVLGLVGAAMFGFGIILMR